MQSRHLLWPLLTLLGCTRHDAPPADRLQTGAPSRAVIATAAAATAAPAVPPLPSGGTAVSTKIVVRNVGQRPVGFGDRAAPHHGFYLAQESGQLGPLTLDGPAGPCECPCSAARCASCAARLVEPIAIAPGAEHRVAWNGLLRRHRRNDHDHCYDTFVPPPGTYVLVACGASCESVRITLPPQPEVPLAIPLRGNPRRADTCATDAGFAERAARVALYTMATELPAFHDPLAAKLGSCDARSARCVPKAELEALRSPAGCALAVAPEPLSYEIRVWLDGTPFSTFVDPDAVTVQRVQYARKK